MNRNSNRKCGRKQAAWLALSGVLVLLCACQSSNENDTWAGYPSSPYIAALAKGEYSLEMSMLYDGTIVSNQLTVKDGNIESRSSVGDSVSHAMRIGDTTYFIDDENGVYFATGAVGQNGLSGSIDYSAARYASSGKTTLLTGSAYGYDEYTCRTYDGTACTVRLYVDEDGELAAIVNSNGTESFEQDISAFSTEVRGTLALPKGYTEVEEETYFEEYYGK